MENYTVGKPIGRGHFSIVYKAKDNRTRQLVALKRISMFELTDETRQKTLQEVDILTHLDHPNIIRCFESFLHDQDLIIVTEYAEMGDLSGMIKKQYETAQPLDEPSIWYAPVPCLFVGWAAVRFVVTVCLMWQAISLPYISLFLSSPSCVRVFVRVSLCVCVYVLRLTYHPLPLCMHRKLFHQIVSAVQHMHHKQIMHRDIKPSNILLTAAGVVKVGDLGLGRMVTYVLVTVVRRVWDVS